MGNGESKDQPAPATPLPSRTPPSSERRKGAGGASAITRQRSPQQVRPIQQHARSGSAGIGLLASSITDFHSPTTTPTANVNATNVAGSTSPARSRPRSVTSSNAALSSHQRLQFSPHLDQPPIAHSHRSDSGAMGNSDSKPVRPPSRANTIPAHTPSPSRPPKQAPEPPIPQNSLPTTSLDVTNLTTDDVADKSEVISPTIPQSPYTLAPANFSRPPRLPLPIEEEVHTPGSPIITPQDVHDSSTLIDQADLDAGLLPRKTSVLSSTTVDDDDVGDNEAFAPDVSQWGEVKVPTKLEWNGSGEKIFVTGTFCSWEKKIKLHRNKDRKGFSAVVNLRPGTHHIKFLVDGEFATSHDLPTTVDWSNILVNYVEIVAPMPAAAEEEKQPPAPATPMPIPGAAMTAGQATGTEEPAARPLGLGDDTHAAETEADLPSTLEEVGPIGEQVGSVADKQANNAVTATPTPVQQSVPHSQVKPAPKPTPAPPKQKLPRPRYTNQIPDFLIDLDNYQNPDEEKFQRAQRVAGTLPAPPSLPMFLSKSILNGATPHKDDASVLIMPNHTVLNHLATSSIKSGVLATSGTTRYKRKFLTTIMYKPTADDG